MRYITINAKNNTIVMTQKFAKEAKKFGSDAYKMLQEARRDYPTYRVVVNQNKSEKKGSFKGLTFEYMQNYIEAKKPEIKDEFMDLIGKSESAKDCMIKSAPYGDVKKWFLNQFPEIKEFTEKRAKTIGKNKKAA